MIDPKQYPNAYARVQALIKRKAVTARSTNLPTPLSEACISLIESGEHTDRTIVFLLRAREAEVQRGERLKQKRR